MNEHFFVASPAVKLAFEQLCNRQLSGLPTAPDTVIVSGPEWLGPIQSVATATFDEPAPCFLLRDCQLPNHGPGELKASRPSAHNGSRWPDLSVSAPRWRRRDRGAAVDRGTQCAWRSVSEEVRERCRAPSSGALDPEPTSLVESKQSQSRRLNPS